MLLPPNRALPSVIVNTEKVLREADWPIKRAVPRPAMRDGWKSVRPRVRLESRMVRAGEEPEEHKRLGSHTFVPISWMCKKQTSVSHSSTESEIISLDAGLRLDGIPALDLWDLIVSVLGNTIQIHDRMGQPVVCRDASHAQGQQSRGMFNVLNNVDRVPSNVQFSHQEALLHVFEDNAAVIKMIIKGRSPTMRHVSRTHTVALDWQFDRINTDPKILIKYIDTKNQLTDMLTKGNFTRDEWNHLLCLFNISHFSFTVCSEGMSKRTQKESGEERVTAKSRPMMSLIARAPSNLSSSASESAGKRSYESQSSWSAKAEEYDIERVHPLLAVTQVTRQGTTTSNLMKARTQDGTMTKLCLLKSGKLMN